MSESLHDFFSELTDTPWKGTNAVRRVLCYPILRFVFAFYRIQWGKNWKFYGKPILQKHRLSKITIGDYLQLRSSVSSNPLAPNHPVVLCTWQAQATLEIGSRFAMTGGVICAANKISIGDNVVVGANCTIIDTDFHPLNSQSRQETPQTANTAPVFIENDVFIGTNSMVMKGVTIGNGSTIGAGSIVTADIPSNAVAAGNPAKVKGVTR